MFRDARRIDPGRLIERDLCIIGGGAAGIALGRELAGRGLRIAILESGGHSESKATQDLYDGKVAGGYLPADSDYLATSRLRYFGGTTNHWAGLCAPFSDTDFESRSWIPDSGWPFDRAHLEPYYARAAPILKVGPFDLASLGRRPLTFDPEIGIETVVKQFGPPVRFGRAFSAELESAPDIEVFLHANVTELRSNREASRIKWAQIATLSGNRFRIRARCFVLAAGGIENARILLSSDSVQPGGLGNDRDLVGRYFMDHLFQLSDPAQVALALPSSALSLYMRADLDPRLGRLTLGRFVLSRALQQRHSLPHNAVGLTPLDPTTRIPLLGPIRALLRGRVGADATNVAVLGIDLEPTPDRNNRVTLGSERDALGMRRVVLEWNVTPRDREGALRTLDVFARQLGRSLKGRVRVAIDSDYDWSRFEYSAHHIGTTRMHDDPARGVVDSHGQVHGVSNLYVAGSSVFPTAGLVNPTLTIIALALRLSERVWSVLGR